MTTFLQSKADLQWIQDVHGIDVSGFSCAFIHGNEDSPDSIQLHEYNHIHAPASVFVQKKDGSFKLAEKLNQ